MNFFHTHVSARSIELVSEVLRSTWVNEGEWVRRFELGLTDTLGLSRPVAVNSGTAALHLALALCGVGPGDEVIVPAQSFVATGMVVLMQRATVVFADIDPLTGGLAPAALAERITPRTRAVIPVHWGGYPCDLDEVETAAARHGVVVVEDAAHALGARYKGRPVGAISRFTAFSFQAIKHLTTGDGGALCCRDAGDAEQAVARRWFGIDRARSRPGPLGARSYDIENVGYKYHMNNVAAAIGLGNLEDFPARLARRRQIGERYRRDLDGVGGLTLMRPPADREPAYWLFPVLVDRRDDFAGALAERGIPTSVVDLGIDRNAVFGGRRTDLPGQARFDAHQISLPIHEGLDEGDVDRVMAAVRKGW